MSMVLHASSRIAAWKYTPLAYVLLVVAGLLNLYFALRMPVTRLSVHSSPSVVHFIEASTVLVQIGIWILAMRGASDLMRYSEKIKNTADGKGMTDVARSLLWLIVYIVLVPLTSSIAEQSSHKAHSYALTVIHNHVPLLAMIIAVSYLYRGSRRLLSLTTSSSAKRRWRLLVILLFAIVAALFVWHFYETVPDMLENRDSPRFALSLTTLLFTYLTPHIVVWLFGTLAILNLWQYSTQVEGSIYRILFRNLYQGILLVFVCTFVAQLITASNVTLSGFNPGVALVYVVLLLGILGYVLIYRGIQQLIKLEAVT